MTTNNSQPSTQIFPWYRTAFLSFFLFTLLLLLYINLTHLISMTISLFSNSPLSISLSSPIQAQLWAILLGCRMKTQFFRPWLWGSLITQHWLLGVIWSMQDARLRKKLHKILHYKRNPWFSLPPPLFFFSGLPAFNERQAWTHLCYIGSLTRGAKADMETQKPPGKWWWVSNLRA